MNYNLTTANTENPASIFVMMMDERHKTTEWTTMEALAPQQNHTIVITEVVGISHEDTGPYTTDHGRVYVVAQVNGETTHLVIELGQDNIKTDMCGIYSITLSQEEWEEDYEESFKEPAPEVDYEDFAYYDMEHYMDTLTEDLNGATLYYADGKFYPAA